MNRFNMEQRCPECGNKNIIEKTGKINLGAGELWTVVYKCNKCGFSYLTDLSAKIYEKNKNLIFSS